MARLNKGAENSISMAFVVMYAEKIQRLIHLLFITVLPGYAAGNGQVISGWGSGIFGSLKLTTSHWITVRLGCLRPPIWQQSDSASGSLFQETPNSGGANTSKFLLHYRREQGGQKPS